MNQALWPLTADNAGWDPRLVVTGRIGKPRAGPFGHACFRIPPGGRSPSSYVEFTAAGSTFSTLVLAEPSGRHLVSVDGAPPVSARGVRVGPHLVTDISTGSDGPHTIRIWGTGDSVDLVAVRASTGAGRLVINTVAISGESLSTFLGGDPAKASAYAGLPFLDTFGFDLLVVALGTNDYNAGTPLDTVRAALTAIVDRQRATDGDVVLSFPPISAPRLYPGPPAPTYADYEQLYAGVAAELGVPFLDLTRLWGPDFAAADAVQPQKYADHAIHPSDNGAHDIAERFRAIFAL